MVKTCEVYTVLIDPIVNDAEIIHFFQSSKELEGNHLYLVLGHYTILLT